jgi:uroporphyrin-III C-methyltransferase
MSKLPAIVALFKKENKANIPIAIIQNGTRKNEKLGVGTIASIEEIVKNQELANPAIIIIGDVIKHRERILNIQGNYALHELIH